MPFDSDVWSPFCAELESRSTHLANEFFSSWKDLAALTARQRESFTALRNAETPAERPQSLDTFLAGAIPALLVDPLAAYSQKRPLQRSLAAIEEYESGLEDLLRRLPRVAELSGRELTSLTHAERSWTGRWRSLGRKPKALAFRDAVWDHVQWMILERAALDGAFQWLLAVSSLHLLGPWQTCQRNFLGVLTKSERGGVDVPGARNWWLEKAARYEQRAAQLQARYEAWTRSAPASIGRALLRQPRPASEGTRAKRAETHQKHLSYWSRQQRAVRAVIDLELHIGKLARDTTGETIASLESLDAEHAELVQELDSAIDWLRQWTDGQASGSFPQPKARLLSSEERLSEWLRRTSARAREELAVTIETVEPRQALPGWRKPWRDLEPARVFLAALTTVGAPAFLSGFREAEAVHRGIIREIERSREVVDYGFETARLERGAGEAFAREAVGNALALLTYQKGAMPEIRPAVEASAAHAAAAVLLESDITLEKSRIGWVAHVTRQRGVEALRQFRSVLRQAVRGASQTSWAGIQRTRRRALLRIGWIAEPRQPAAPVIHRVDLGETLAVQLHARDLPMIYRRLFRLAPVEDPRFLVGRESEMAGFADALKGWQAGKGASVMVIGARGSGKTSLINCAASDVFAGCEVVRGQFCARLGTPAQMYASVRDLFRMAGDGDLAAALSQSRRVVLMEEFERTFLRTPGGFEALRALLDLMYATTRSTLWVFSINETAYRYLDAVVGLGRHFSHHINAMSVKQSDLSSAILQRHNLSGLRLEFAPLPEEDPRVSGIRRFLGFEQDSQRLFLDALYEQSEGIFRAAFELWQGCIERVEGGIVHMRQPLAPDYQELTGQMTLEDCFVLKAILQHGSLTAEELSQVLATSREDSLRQLERLHLLEVLEKEPVSPGVRVRPEAGRLVRETLGRLNLL
jgi:hypothetical protein